MSRMQVAIIGGGLAGMSAALALREQPIDLDITLYESRRTTGGRAGSFVDSQTGDSVDYCQHVAMGCCTNLLAMMRHAGLEDAFTRYSELSFHHPDHAPARFDKSKLLPAPFHLLPSLLRLPYLSWRQRYEISHGIFALMRARPKDLVHITAGSWLVDHGQSANTIRNHWDVVIASALGESCNQVSMAAARKVFIDGFLVSHESSDILVPVKSLATLFGVELPKSVVRQRVFLKTGTKVRTIAMTSDDSIQIVIENNATRFDHVILAVPFFALSKVLNRETAIAAGLAAERYANVPCSPITGIHLWFDKPILRQPHAVMVGTLSQWVFQRQSDAQTLAANSHYIQVVISASHGLRQMHADELIAQVVRELRHAFPLAANAKLIHGRIVTDPQAVFSLRPDVDAMRPASRTGLPCLHLAGDFVQTGWPATMEGAVISGRMAASSLLEKLGYPAVTIDPGLRPSLLSRWLIRT